MDQLTNVDRRAYHAAGQAVLAHLSPSIGGGMVRMDPEGYGAALEVDRTTPLTDRHLYELMRAASAGPIAAVLASGTMPPHTLSLREHRQLAKAFGRKYGRRLTPQRVACALAAAELLLLAHWGAVRKVKDSLFLAAGVLTVEQVSDAIHAAPRETRLPDDRRTTALLRAVGGDPLFAAWVRRFKASTRRAAA